MSFEELKAKNIEEAKSIFEYITESGFVPKKQDETISYISFYRLLRGEYVFFRKKYLKGAVGTWRALAKNHPEVEKWIRIYEQRLKSKDDMGEIGERIVDLSSGSYPYPVCLSMALECEAVPKWGSIMLDFRKLLNVLAPVKVGIFHLPARHSTSNVWTQDKETGELEWVDKTLDGNKPEELIEDMIKEVKNNTLEHPYTIYLIILVHAHKEVIYGYLFWREITGEVKFGDLPSTS